MPDAPGTVSRILWHFTGGPRWNEIENRQLRNRKSAVDAYNALLGILQTRTLKLGHYQEVVKVRVPKVRYYNRATKRFNTKRNVLRSLKSAAVCCLADIPLLHLSYQASRYGKFAVGFHREAAIRHGFNPVFYTLHDTNVIQSIYRGFAEIQALDADSVRTAAGEIESELKESNVDVWSELLDIDIAADDIETAVDSVRHSIEEFLAFVKTIDRKEFGTVYCEREWRATKTFAFERDDIAMIVLPGKVGAEKYFASFVATEVKRLHLPRSIPIVPWEDLVES